MQPIVDFDKQIELSIRPKKLHDFIGQSGLKQNLNIFIQSANLRKQTLDHVLFFGPPGLGKTTLANIISSELESGIKITSGPALTKTGDLAAILTNLSERDVLFIDEIHRLPVPVEEMLYSAMEDYRLDIVLGEGPSARIMKIDLNKFTLVGATTRLGLISKPLQDRFGIVNQLEFYNQDELSLIIKRLMQMQNINITEDASSVLSLASRGTPRIAIRNAKRIIDINLMIFKKDIIGIEEMSKSLEMLGIDKFGLDKFDKKYLHFIHKNYNGGPVGIETISAGLSEDRTTIEESVEPFLIQIGLLERTSRGRVLTSKYFLNYN